MTTIRSPGRTSSSPRGITTPSSRMIAATRESGGSRASRSGVPRMLGSAFSVTSNSTICTWPSANTSVCRAAGTPIVREIANAVSTSDETMKSTSSWPSRHTSRYSGFVVRTTVVVRDRAGLRDHRGDDVRLVARRAGDQQVGLGDPGGREHAPAGAVALHRVRRRSAARSRPAAPRRGRRPSARARREAPATIVAPTWPAPMMKIFTCGGYCPGTSILWLSWPPMRSLLAFACLAALVAACAAGAAPERAPVQAARGRKRLLGADLRHRREGRAGPALRRRAGRRHPRAPGRQAPRHAAPRHPQPRPGRRRARAARARVPPLVPEGAQALRAVHRPRRLDEGRRVPDEREPRLRAAAALLEPRPVREPQRRHARVRPERPAPLHDGRRRRGRRPGEPLAEPALAVRQAALDQRRDEGAQDRGVRPAERLAVLVRPRERRPLHRRRRPGLDRGDRLDARERAPVSRTTAGTSTRAARSSRTRRSAPASSSPRSRSTATTTAARSRAATPTAARTRRCAGATSTATTAAGSSGASSSPAARRRACGARRSRSRA